MLRDLTRRDAMKTLGAGALATGFGNFIVGNVGVEAAEPPLQDSPLPYELGTLPYPHDGLEPQISEEILQIHHSRHHAAYVEGLNATLEKLEQVRSEGDFSDIRALSRDLAFNGAGHVLHVLYWNSMTPGGSSMPAGSFRNAVERDFGSVEKLQDHFVAASVAVEANGWGLLGFEPVGRRLMVLQIENHQRLTTWGFIPLMTCDVWEHAYYLQYQNRRAEYVNNFMEIIDWPAVAERYDDAVS